MCSMSKLNITVQDVTREIIEVMSLYEFPQINFIVKGHFEELIRNFEALESEVFFLHDLIELWYVDRKCEHWSLDNIIFSQHLLFSLKHIKLRNFPFVRIFGTINLSKAYYKELLISYIGKIKNDKMFSCKVVEILIYSRG